MGLHHLWLRPVRVANCAAIGSDEEVLSVECTFWNAELPSKRVSTVKAAGGVREGLIDTNGGASFDDADDLWLPLSEFCLGVMVRAVLSVYIRGRADPVKASIAVSIDFERPRSIRRLNSGVLPSPSDERARSSPSDAGSVWCQLRGGAAHGELLFRWERCAAAHASSEGRRARPGQFPPSASPISQFGPLSRITEESPSVKRAGVPRGNTAPVRDAQGFDLLASPEEYAEFRNYYWLRCEAQLRGWADAIDRARAAVAGSGLVWASHLRAHPAELAATVALGVPSALRPVVWLALSGAADMRRAAGAAGSYTSLAAAEPPPPADDDPPSSAQPHCAQPRRAQRVLDAIRSRVSLRAPPAAGLGWVSEEAAQQIDLDLRRTFPEHPEYQSAAGRARLRRVLCAHCARNPVAGYTQSLNFIAAFLLLQLPDSVEGGASREEAAFWLLEAVTERLLPGYFTEQLAGVQADLRVLDELVGDHPQLRGLSEALARLNLDLRLISTQWLMLGFLTALPSETAVRVWDLFLWAGPRALLAASLATLRLLHADLLAAASFEQAYSILKCLHVPTLDCDRFVRLALQELHALPPDRLCALRGVHLPQVLRELATREATRRLALLRADAPAAGWGLGARARGSASRLRASAARLHTLPLGRFGAVLIFAVAVGMQPHLLSLCSRAPGVSI